MQLENVIAKAKGLDLSVENLEKKFTQTQFGQAAQMQIFKRLARYLDRKQPLNIAIERLIDIYSKKGTKPNTTEAKALQTWFDELSEGIDFNHAVGPWVQPTYRGLITAGSKSGEVAESLHRTVRLMHLTGEIRKKIRGALVYPVLIITYVAGLITFMGNMLVPMFRELAHGQPMPIGPQMIEAFSTFMTAEWKMVLIGLVSAFIGIMLALPRYTGPGRTQIDDFPIFRLYRILNGIVFLYALGAMTKAKMGVDQALYAILEDSTPWMASRIDPVIVNLQEGAELGDAFEQTGHGFPDDTVIGDLYVFQASGGLDTGLIEVAEMWIEETQDYAERLSKTLNKWGLLIAALAIVGFYLSIFQLYSLVGG